MKVTISKIFVDDEITKTKYGDAQKMGIKVNDATITLDDGKDVEVADRWLYGFLGKVTREWKVGDIVDISVSERASGDKKYLNFKVKTVNLEDRIKKLEDAVFGSRDKGETVIQTEDEPEF